MISNRQFAAHLVTLRRADEALRELIAEALAFAYFHAAQGQHTPMNNLKAAPVVGWLSDALSKLPKGRKEKLGESEAEARASAWVAVTFATQEQKRAISRANRAARAEKKESVSNNTPDTENVSNNTPEAEELNIPPKLEVSVPALILASGTVELSEDEGQALVQYLMEMRASTLKLAA